MKSKYAALLAASLTIGGSSWAQPPARSSTIIRTDTRVVLVDAVVADKGGNYVHGLAAKDFHVWDDNKEQSISSFSSEAAAPLDAQRHYIVLFFDNSHMDFDDQPRARRAAERFVESTAGPNRMMAVVNFGGSMQIAQNFTDNADRLKNVASGVKPGVFGLNEVDAVAGPELVNAASNFGARNVFLALRSLADGLRSLPGRKSLIFLSTGSSCPPITLS